MPSKKLKISSIRITDNLDIQGGVTIGAIPLTNAQFRESFTRNLVSGQALFTTPGTFSWTVPEGVFKISAVAVGSGGAGYYAWANGGGTGGGLAYANNILVEPGDVVSIIVGGERAMSNSGGRGLPSSVGSFFSATAGRDCNGNWTAVDSDRGTFANGTVEALGGSGGLNSNTTAGGGGGAAGYSGNGGNGYYGSTGQTPYNGQGGGGAGSSGYDSSTYGFAGAGGVGLNGEGQSGVWGSLTNQGGTPTNNGNNFQNDYRYAGAGGSGGEHGMANKNGSTLLHGRTMYYAEGGRYGGAGGGGGSSVTNDSNYCKGAQGAVKIVWSTNTNFDISQPH
jgi:hypothetical protein